MGIGNILSRLRHPAKDSLLPDYLLPAHNLCYQNHDILLELLRAGEEQDVFSCEFQLREDAERVELETCGDIFDWFERTGRLTDRAEVLKRTVFPAVLSDFLHFVYEALRTSRKAKLTTAYALLRKPIQENLFLLEVISTDAERFAQHLANTPMKLQSRTQGGIDVHARRIRAALAALGEDDRFDAEYIARVRYDKNDEDSFAGSSDKALHLFTEHAAIRTEPLNLNFIFSGWDAKLTQWHYLYSRLPYLLFYARRLVEHLCGTFVRTDPIYLADIERRVSAETLLWARNIDAAYRHSAIDQFVSATRNRLARDCADAGFREPQLEDLPRMRDFGAYPGEADVRVRLRNASYAVAGMRRRAARAWGARRS